MKVHKSRTAFFIAVSNEGSDLRNEPSLTSVSSQCEVDVPSRCGATDCTNERCNAREFRVRYTLTFGDSLTLDAIHEVTGCKREREIVFSSMEWFGVYAMVERQVWALLESDGIREEITKV
jgi:hypothetical protein